MSTVTIRSLTFEEFERLPEQAEPGKRELLNGEVIESPPADLEHANFSKFIYHLLLDALPAAHTRREAAELGEVYHETGYKLPGERYLQPDVSVTHTAQAHGKYLNGAPALAVEVISESNTAREMAKKLTLYFFHGGREVWRVYRDPVHIVVHLSDGTSRTVRHSSVTTPLLPNCELRLADLEALIEKY
jgi:Uma2 family endonuclease